MKDFIDIYNENVNSFHSQLAFVDDKEQVTYAELDKSAGKIYRYLKEQGIGTEDFVQIVMRRGVRIPVCFMGVVKAGAAFMILEDTYPQDRIEFIYEDCGCKLRIDDELYEHIMSDYDPLEGNEDANPHDACYAVYTSGSTGNPKGVIHEYGNLNQAHQWYETKYDDEIKNSAIFAPFYFVAGVIDISHYLVKGRTVYIVPHGMTRDFVAVQKFIENNEIHEMFLPPSYLRIYKNPSKSLKVLYTGSEPANGLTYNNSPALINFYAMSESGFVVLCADLNKRYDIAPVGQPVMEDIEVRLLDDDGNVVEGPGQGELCYINQYVRGYINLQEQTDKTWRGGLYHTNDLVKRGEDGQYYLVGRFDDMIKINGNRVEPVEIETKVKEVTGLTQAVAKGFKIKNRTFICLYYLIDEAETLNIYKEGELTADMSRLSDMLPDYMIPTYYVPLKAFPLLPNGKTARKSLMPPSMDEVKTEYVAPTTDTEKKICDLYAEVLKLDRVGITDDFYTIGGDSMSAIVIAARFVEEGLNIDTKTLYSNRTPAELAAYYEANMELLKDRVNKTYDNSKMTEIPNMSGRIFKRQLDDGIPGEFTFYMTSQVNVDALSQAYNKVLEDYPFFNYTVVLDEDGDTLHYKELGYIPKVRPYEKYTEHVHYGMPMIEAMYKGDAIIITNYHALTDGYGFFHFINTLLHNYINITENRDDELPIRNFDYCYDMGVNKVETDSPYKMYDTPEVYKLPEFDPKVNAARTFFINMDRNDFLGIQNKLINDYNLDEINNMQGIGGPEAFVAGYLLMKAIADARPEADKPLMCRFPINMRYALDKEDTLRNCSQPQSFYNITVEELNQGATPLHRVCDRILEQTASLNVNNEINRLIDYLNDPTADAANDPIFSYIAWADVLATNLGKITYDSDAKYVRDFAISFVPSCLTSIQACVKGNTQILIINQKFEDDRYINKLVDNLREQCDKELTVEEIK